MSDERLKEIKDSIDLQLEYAKHLDEHNELALEEKELYDYAELLKERVSYLEKSIVRKEETIAELEQERVPYTNEYVDKVKKENEELKKQLEEKTKIGIADHKYASKCEDKVVVMQVKQQEFMNYLKDIIDWEPVVIEKILQKYKEIIGGNKYE